MEAQEIISILDQNTMSVKGLRFPTRRFNGVALLTGELRITLADKNVVFFSPVSYFNKLPADYSADRLFMLYVDTPLKPLPADSSVLLFKEHNHWIDAYELLSREFRILQRKKEQLIGLAALVNRGGSLKQLANAAAAIIDAPCSILDSSLTFLAASDNFPDWAHDRDQNGDWTLSERALQTLKQHGLITPSRPRDLIEFDFIDASNEPATNYFSFIHQKSNIIGSISFFMKGKKLRKSRQEMIPAISQNVGIELQKSNTYLLNKSLYYTHLFHLMEEGSINESIEQFRTRFAFFGYTLKKYLHIVLVDGSQEYMPSEEVHATAKRLQHYLPNSVYVIQERGIVYLLSSDEILEESACDQESLREALRPYSIDIGISSIYLDPDRTPSYIAEAQRAIAVGRKVNPEAHVYPFSRYRMLDLANNVMDGKVLYSYRYPPLVHVIDHDAEHNTNLALTLYEYLQNPTEPDVVAEKLFIHKNTLYYRLGKIREIMGRDFKDAETITCIQMTFHVLRIQGRFEKLILRNRNDQKLRK